MADCSDDARPLEASAPVHALEERWVGRVLRGRYVLSRLVGVGGSAALFAGRDLITGDAVALKVIVPRPSDTRRDSERFVLEADVARGLSHPNIVATYDAGVEPDGTAFLVMELLEGSSLADELEAGVAVDPRQVLEWLVPIMGALAFAHDRGILHRDIKPENIFLARGTDGSVCPKLLDFGVAKALGAVTITHSGVVVGTPAYMSPEQALGETLTASSDVWSLGVVLFQCLSGRLPFSSDSPTAMLIKIADGQAPLLASAGTTVPARLASAVDRALRREPAHRYVDMQSFAHALHNTALREGISLPAPPDEQGLPKWRSWRADQAKDTVEVALSSAQQTQAPMEEYAIETTYRAAGVFVGSVGNALISWTGGGVDTRAMAAAAERSQRLSAVYPEGIARLVVIDAPVTMPNAAQREEFQRLTNEFAARTLAHALVLRGGGLWMSSQRMVIRAMLLAVRVKFPCQLFEDVERAARWLEQVAAPNAKFSAAAIVATLRLPKM